MGYARNMHRFIFFILLTLASLPVTGISQAVVPDYPELDAQFSTYEIMTADAADLCRQLRSPKRDAITTLTINESTSWRLRLRYSGIISENYVLTVASEKGITKIRGTIALPMQGEVEGYPGSEVSLTFNDDFIYGFIRLGMQMYYVEPLYHFVKGGDKSKFVVYSVRDIKPGPERKCGYDDYAREMQRVKKSIPQTSGNRMPGGCLEIQVNTASDFSMHQHYGLTGTQNHNLGVLNNVQTNYDNEFPDQLQLIMGEQWISTCSTCDPWTSSLDPGDLLDDFTNWGLTGFSVAHDVASCWTRRDFLGGTIGLAWVGVVCSQYKYNVLQDFSTNAELKRVLMAHEMGHNFDASHNTGIMAPSVSTATNWSSTSVSEIEAHYLSVSCLSNCSSGAAPSPDFDYVLADPCQPATMDFTSLATNATTWQWTFPGGSPGYSTLQNPSVQYTTAGVYNVTLEVSNAYGSNSTTVPVYVGVIPNAVANFQYTINNHVVSFNFTGTSANTFNWDFGDGTAPSTAQNPTHTYPFNGTYDVTLEVGNACGTSSITIPVTINVLPFVNFTGVPLSGCQQMTVGFTNLSTNAITYNWSFPGGTPATSTAPNPVVVYNTPGSHQVTLEATNSAGTNVLIKTNYVNVDPLPVGGFSSTVSGAVATFTNQAAYADSLIWYFGDGQSSTDPNPVHTYTTNDTFTVTQVLTNPCGAVQYSQQVVIAAPPTASFAPAIPDTLCAGQSVQFVSTTTNNPLSLTWIFEGGSPATSADSMPMVTYAVPGVYDVSLIVTNAFGSDTMTVADYMTVNSVPSVSFNHAQSALEVSFISQISNGTGLQWQFGDGSTSNEANPVHPYSEEGNYNVTLFAENVCGDSTYVAQVSVFLFPDASVQLSDDTICYSNQIQYTGGSGSSATQWLWIFDGGLPDTATTSSPVVTYTVPGQYTTTLITSNSSGSDTVQTQIVILPGAEADMDIAQSGFRVDCVFTGSQADSLQWLFGDGSTSTETNPSHTYAVAGTYLVQAIAYNECKNDTTAQLIVILPSGTSEAVSWHAIRVAPNPTSGMVQIISSAVLEGPLNATVSDVTGRQIATWVFSDMKPGEPLWFDMAGISEGVYFLTLRTGKESHTWLLVKTDR